MSKAVVSHRFQSIIRIAAAEYCKRACFTESENGTVRRLPTVRQVGISGDEGEDSRGGRRGGNCSESCL